MLKYLILLLALLLLTSCAEGEVKGTGSQQVARFLVESKKAYTVNNSEDGDPLSINFTEKYVLDITIYLPNKQEVRTYVYVKQDTFDKVERNKEYRGLFKSYVWEGWQADWGGEEWVRRWRFYLLEILGDD